MYVDEDDLPPAARGRRGVSREVVREDDPFIDPTVREWVETQARDDPEAGDE